MYLDRTVSPRSECHVRCNQHRSKLHDYKTVQRHIISTKLPKLFLVGTSNPFGFTVS